MGNSPEPGTPGELEPVASLTHQASGNHLHGMGFDEDADRVFLATHYGLFVLQDATTETPALYQVGESRDDFMGFTLHPRDGSTMWASGHPAGGGNMGVIQSHQDGFNWTPLSEGGPQGPVDFHGMTVSPADPNVLAGAHAGQLYVSEDAGESWTLTGQAPQGACFGAPCLAMDPDDRERVYAGTTQGLLRSEDLGNSWEAVHEAGTGGVAVHPDGTWYAFVQGDGLVRSDDGGSSWTPLNEGLEIGGREAVFAIEPHREDPDVLWVATTGDEVYRSLDGASSWQRVVP